MKTICTFMLVLGLQASISAQTELEPLVSSLVCHPFIQTYFKGSNICSILNTPPCNSGNLDVSKINSCKSIYIGSKEEMFMRSISKWIEIRDIQVQGTEAVVKVFFTTNSGSIDIHLSRKGEAWEFRSELTPDK